jgi:hypothetical protein
MTTANNEVKKDVGGSSQGQYTSKVLSQQLSTQAVKYHQKKVNHDSMGRDSNQGPSKYKLETFLLQPTCSAEEFEFASNSWGTRGKIHTCLLL